MDFLITFPIYFKKKYLFILFITVLKPKILKPNTINIQNKKAFFEYEIMERITAGMVLTGTEIKSIRLGKARITESFCEFNEQLFAVNMYIEEFVNGNFYNHKPRNPRKLLLNRRELKKWHRKVQDVGLTIVPLKLFISSEGYAKLEIALCKGKKMHDKRHTMKDRDNKRDLDRVKKDFKKD